MRKAVLSGVLALTLGPAAFLLALGALLNPAAQASCLPTTSGAFSNVGNTAAPIPETSHVVMPLPAGTWVKTSGFGIRVHPVTGETKLHTGVDLAAPTGTHILAAADGRVVFAGAASGYGNLILIEHNVGGRTVATGYAHMYADGIHVKVGQSVTAGEYIADVGVSRLLDRSAPPLRGQARRRRRRTDRPGAVAREPRSGRYRSRQRPCLRGLRSRWWPGITVQRRQPWKPRRRPDDRRPDHRANRPHPRPDPGQLPGEFVGLLVTAARPDFGALARPRLRRNLRQRPRHSRDWPRPRLRLAGHQLGEGQRQNPRRRVRHLAGPDLVSRSRRRRLEEVRRRRDARPQQRHRRATTTTCTGRPSRKRDLLDTQLGESKAARSRSRNAGEGFELRSLPDAEECPQHRSPA